MSPGDLAELLGTIPTFDDPNVLVGFQTSDDGAVYKISADVAIVQSIDVLTPVVDSPYDFGRIAAANSVSDIYAMGGTPRFALSFAGFPKSVLPMSVLAEITRGAMSVAQEAGMAVIGGHTIDDPEPKYGMAVTGVVDPNDVVTNSAGKAGDLLVLTKPLGSGVVTTAAKRDKGVTDKELAEAVDIMATLNAGAASVMTSHGIRCATDVTGFGLLGHLIEICNGSGLGAVLTAKDIPIMDAARRLGAEGVFPGGSRRNLEYLSSSLMFEVDETTMLLLADAQTSGGLLMAVAPEKYTSLKGALRAANVATCAMIGHLEPVNNTVVRVL